jgi:hypothetical protein
MSNTPKGRDCKGGSKDWMQRIINSDLATRLDEKIGDGKITWLSPIEDDNYKEYRLNEVPNSWGFGFDKRTFSGWWPSAHSPQPQWDAIGKTNDGKIALIEAKAHLNEFGTPTKATEESRKVIIESLKNTHRNLAASIDFDENLWMGKYYQTANRLLFWDNLRTKREIILVFLNLVDVPRSPTSEKEWDKHTKQMFELLLGVVSSGLPSEIKIVNFDASIDNRKLILH